jgi:hypothetical protein
VERRDDAVERLLDPDGFLAELGGGFWIKIVEKCVTPDVNRPHGVRYSLTLTSPARGTCSELIMPTRWITCIGTTRSGPTPTVTLNRCSRISGVRSMPR